MKERIKGKRLEKNSRLLLFGSIFSMHSQFYPFHSQLGSLSLSFLALSLLHLVSVELIEEQCTCRTGQSTYCQLRPSVVRHMRTPRLLSMPTTEVQGALVQRVDVGGRQVMDGVEKEGGQRGHSDVLTTPSTVIMHDVLQV